MTVLYQKAAEGVALVGPTGQATLQSLVSVIDKVKWAMQQQPGLQVGWGGEGVVGVGVGGGQWWGGG
jgi:hypothetical protein